MKKLEISQMENLQGGTNRQCLIDGVLGTVGGAVGFLGGGIVGGIAAVLASIGAANSNGCFDSKK